jgi:hypothetical protein
MMRNKAYNKDNPEENKGETEGKKVRFRILLVIFGIIVPFTALYLYFTYYYNNHFYSNTEINGINTSNMTINKAEGAVNARAKTYQLKLLGRNNKSDTIYGEDINLHTVFDGNISDLLRKQKALLWPVAMFRQQKLELNTMLKYDENLLKQQFDQLNCFQDAHIIEPVNASISEYGPNGYEIIPERPGAKVKKEKLYNAVLKAIDSLETSISLEELGCYEEPKLTSQSSDLKKAVNKMNMMAGTEIVYHFGTTTEILNGEQISKWLSVDDKLKVQLDKDGVREYVDYIGKTYNTFGKFRSFKTSYGNVITVKGGDYGWWLNRPEETSELIELIKKGTKQEERKPVYYQTAQQYGQDDIGNTYVEVNLTAQHLFFYKNGKLILESDFVSGNVAKNHATPVGTYPVQYKENDATLVGEDYETPVKYWMPFNKDIGFHDAPWRNKFGGKVYLTNGSHGCINMPPAKAKKMFQNIKRGVAVVVYKLPGTESPGSVIRKTKAAPVN